MRDFRRLHAVVLLGLSIAAMPIAPLRAETAPSLIITPGTGQISITLQDGGSVTFPIIFSITKGGTTTTWELPSPGPSWTLVWHEGAAIPRGSYEYNYTITWSGGTVTSSGSIYIN